MENSENDMSIFDLIVTQEAITILDSGDISRLNNPAIVPDEKTRTLVIAYLADSVFPYLCKKNKGIVIHA